MDQGFGNVEAQFIVTDKAMPVNAIGSSGRSCVPRFVPRDGLGGNGAIIAHSSSVKSARWRPRLRLILPGHGSRGTDKESVDHTEILQPTSCKTSLGTGRGGAAPSRAVHSLRAIGNAPPAADASLPSSTR